MNKSRVSSHGDSTDIFFTGCWFSNVVHMEFQAKGLKVQFKTYRDPIDYFVEQ